MVLFTPSRATIATTPSVRIAIRSIIRRSSATGVIESARLPGQTERSAAVEQLTPGDTDIIRRFLEIIRPSNDLFDQHGQRSLRFLRKLQQSLRFHLPERCAQMLIVRGAGRWEITGCSSDGGELAQRQIITLLNHTFEIIS